MCLQYIVTTRSNFNGVPTDGGSGVKDAEAVFASRAIVTNAYVSKSVLLLESLIPAIKVDFLDMAHYTIILDS